MWKGVFMSDLMEIIRKRRTIRKFEATPVADEKIRTILEAGRWAPSFSNLQPLKFMVVKDPALKKGLDAAASQSVLHWGIEQAPVVIVVCADRQIDSLHTVSSGAAATQNMTLMAQNLGLGSGWIGIAGTGAEVAIQTLLQLPETMGIVSMVTLGIPGESPEGLRKPLDEMIEFR